MSTGIWSFPDFNEQQAKRLRVFTSGVETDTGFFVVSLIEKYRNCFKMFYLVNENELTDILKILCKENKNMVETE